MSRRDIVAALFALPALGAPALAQTRSCQSACLQEARRSAGPDPAHACAIRCAAADAFRRQERSRPARPVRLPSPDGFGIILAAPPPSASFGPAVGAGDRMSAWTREPALPLS